MFNSLANAFNGLMTLIEVPFALHMKESKVMNNINQTIIS